MFRKQVTSLAGEHSLSGSISASLSEPVLSVCMFSGALFRYRNLLSDYWSKSCAKGYVSALHLHPQILL